jgi:phosphoribosylaminoimidazole-succinocarboxamide synthase
MGKSKTVSELNAEELILRFKDTATAFNGEKLEEFPDKGKLCAAISNLIYAYLEKNGIETHLVEVIDDTSVKVKKAEIIMVEAIVRNIAAGSFSKKYGIAEGAPLKNTVFEFSLKNDALGDPIINISQITAIGLAASEELSQMIRQSQQINELLCGLFASAGLRLIDFKLEFGRHGDAIILCDEISPDSCRLWDTQTGEKFDKDRFRLESGNLTDGYREVLRRLQNKR